MYEPVVANGQAVGWLVTRITCIPTCYPTALVVVLVAQAGIDAVAVAYLVSPN